MRRTIHLCFHPRLSVPGPSENLSITNKSDKLSLNVTSAFLFTISGKPPILSLTVYGADQYLVPDELSRYIIGDQTPGLKFENGDLLVIGALSFSLLMTPVPTSYGPAQKDQLKHHP
jgi:hypothetical protein